MKKGRNEPGSRLDPVGASPADVDHDENLIDESIEETFPASDPTLPVRPGSSLSIRNQVARNLGAGSRSNAAKKKAAR